MGGEKLYCIAAFCSMWGSPPRRRGKGESLAADRRRERITPAWAGKSSPLDYTSNLHTDHPRVGGEKEAPLTQERVHVGSPPRRRGKVRDDAAAHALAGITPAWAGKSVLRCLSLPRIRDHPRVGGEKSSPFSLFMTLWGSPPHGRGKEPVRIPFWQILRITPAWAGKSRS